MIYKVRIYGSVQGVGFRYFVKNTADALGLKGWVKNCDDGSVELSVEASSCEIDHFADVIEKGNGHSRVECIDMIESPPSGHFNRFEILS